MPKRFAVTTLRNAAPPPPPPLEQSLQAVNGFGGGEERAALYRSSGSCKTYKTPPPIGTPSIAVLFGPAHQEVRKNALI